MAPYFAVLAEPRFLHPSPDALAEFHRSGDASITRLLASIDARAHGGPGRIRTALEFGCGPGRLAGALARRNFTVTAVDIAQPMLDLTRAAAPNVEVLLEHQLDASRTFDLVTCVLVLQHVDDAPSLVRRLLAHVAPGGFLHLQFPFRTRRSTLSRTMLAARERIPLVNRLVNATRRRDTNIPLLVPHVHSLDAILGELTECAILHVDIARENELDTVQLTVARHGGDARPPMLPPAPQTDDFIDVRELMRATSLDEWNRRAEQYFAGLTSTDVQLAKPFASPADAPSILISAGAVIQAARLVRGLTVLDLGAGTGWLTRALTQLGCRVISVDVSQSALDISRRDLETRPVVGDQPSPTFLRFDGHYLELDDESVDRIVCFDAFHHVPNPDEVLRELARVLKPGGIAAFSEPGPRHSHSAQSQFEMRTYGVLENDVDLHELASLARDAGLVDMQIALYTADPRMVDLASFDELLSGGTALVDAAKQLRDYLRNAHTFTLRKPGEEVLDSRTASALRADIDVVLREEPRANEPIVIRATVRNSGAGAWLPSPALPGGVCLGVHLYVDDELATFDHHWEPLPNGLRPGELATLDFQLPPLGTGRYTLEFDCVAQNVAWFASNGSATKRVLLELR